MPLFRREPPKPAQAPDPVQVVLGYHQRTKHEPHRPARSLGFLDWDNQPDPFRRFEGAPLVELGFPPAPAVAYGALYGVGAPVALASLSRESLSTFLFHALALSAWKSIPEARWSLRVDPSSGNLHPTEGWLVLPALGGLHDGPALWHYAPREHGLERRATLDPAAWERLAASLGPGGFLVALSSIPWREAWKYGERAFRYCQHDLGHCLGALALSAALLGWRLRRLPAVPSAGLATLLGLDRPDAAHEHEEEVAEVLVIVEPADGRRDVEAAGGPAADDAAIVDAVAPLAANARFAGRARRLSAEHHPWDLIAVVEQATRVTGPRAPGTPVAARAPGPHAPSPVVDRRPTPPVAGSASANAAALLPPHLAPPAGDAATLIRQRRSAVAMDGRSGMSRAAFLSCLARVTPALTPAPFQVLASPPGVHLALFVHRVDDLAPGLYLLLRAADGEALLRPRMRREFAWERPDGTPDGLPLVRLHSADLRGTAAAVSCNQEIAADGAFAVAMLADLGGALSADGPAAYRALHWEAGLVGQVLYLEAEAHGLRATGIGCFFDDALHAVLGLADGRVQTLYHFTVGGPVDDSRLTTGPAYPAPSGA